MFPRDPRRRAPSDRFVRPRPSLPRLLAALAFAAIGALLPASALAQLALGTNVDRDDPHAENNEFRFWLSKADCEDDVEYRFPVTVTPSSGTFQLWISAQSADCTLPEQRTGVNAQCYRVPTNKDGVIGNTNWPVNIGAKAIATALPDINDACEDTTNSALPRPVVLYFLQLDTDTTVISSATYDQINIDLVPPAAPVVDASDVQSGEGSLTFGYGTPDQGTEKYYLRYDFYCDPPPGTQVGGSGCDCLGNVGTASSSTSTTGTTTTTTTTTDTVPAPPAPAGGAGGTGGTGGATTTNTSTAAGGTGGTGGAGGAGGDGGGTTCVAGTCESCDIVAGAPALGQDSAFYCGSQTAVSTGSAAVSGLDNGTPYVVAMVAVDELGNTSAMSTPVCATPAEATDFYESYKARGGEGGGGACSLRPWSTRTSALGPLGAALAVLALAGRRIARRRRSNGAGVSR